MVDSDHEWERMKLRYGLIDPPRLGATFAALLVLCVALALVVAYYEGWVKP